ncbi:MAG TPA: hypothetical protein VN579_07245 [Bryobacteraceae bacterium]|nr:hypothetical protein [Bryobacteraceae bacterium]
MDLLGVQADIAKTQAALNEAVNRISQLEVQSAKDVNAITDKLIAAVLPEVRAARGSIDQLTMTLSASVQEALVTIRRINGATIKFELGPEAQ